MNILGRMSFRLGGKKTHSLLLCHVTYSTIATINNAQQTRRLHMRDRLKIHHGMCRHIYQTGSVPKQIHPPNLTS